MRRGGPGEKAKVEGPAKKAKLRAFTTQQSQTFIDKKREPERTSNHYCKFSVTSNEKEGLNDDRGLNYHVLAAPRIYMTPLIIFFVRETCVNDE